MHKEENHTASDKIILGHMPWSDTFSAHQNCIEF